MKNNINNLIVNSIHNNIKNNYVYYMKIILIINYNGINKNRIFTK